MVVPGALESVIVHDNADDFHVVGRIEFLQNFFGVGHLRHRFGRDEGDGVDEDRERREIEASLAASDSGRPTTVKTRIIAHHQQVVRAADVG